MASGLVACGLLRHDASMSPRPTRPFEWWWTLVGAALGAGVGWQFPAIGIPLGAALGVVAGLAAALLRKSREWRGSEAPRPHFHERRKPAAHKHH